MKITTSYTISFKDGYDAVKRTTAIFNCAIQYLTGVARDNWGTVEKIATSKERVNYVESLVHETESNKPVYKNFDKKFYKFPSYYRRNAIMSALGIVSSYMSSIDNWVANDCKGAMPKIDKATHQMPCFYRVNCFRNWKDDTAEIKVYRNNDWVWQKIRLNHSDRVYLERKAGNTHLSAPVLVKKHGKYELRFTLKKEVELSSKEIFNQKVCACRPWNHNRCNMQCVRCTWNCPVT